MVSNTVVGNGESEILIGPPGKTRAILSLYVCNTGASSGVFTLYLKAVRANVGSDSNTVVKNVTLDAHKTWVSPEKMLIADGQALSGKIVADSGETMTVTVNYQEY